MIQQARHKLHELESATPVAAGEVRPAPVALAPQPHPVVEELEAVRPDELTPVRPSTCSIASSRCCKQLPPRKHAKGEPRGSPFYIQRIIFSTRQSSQATARTSPRARNRLWRPCQ